MRHATPNLIIHIGPPKTATTSLQIALESDGPEGISYLGAYQPRERNGRSLCQVLHDVSKRPNLVNSPRFQEFKSKVLYDQSVGKIPIVVEEAILVSSGGVSWQKKMANLAIITKDINPIIAITLRDPIHGVPSLHRELFRELSALYKISLFAFTRSAQCQVFNYRRLLKEIRNLGFERVCLLRFSDISSGELNISGLNHNITGDVSSIKITHENARQHKKAGPGVLALYLKGWHDDFLRLDRLSARFPGPAFHKIDDVIMEINASR